ncbi:MAG: hypothetical protein AAGA31_04690 [Bacteroidota bacterium]
MRQQYHSRNIGPDVLIWDVNALIQANDHLPTKKILLSDIQEFEENWWYQSKNSVPTCQSIVDHFHLIAACELKYPILLGPKGRLIDGMHRVCKAHLEGRTFILARQLLKLPSPDYRNVDFDDLPYEDE